METTGIVSNQWHISCFTIDRDGDSPEDFFLTGYQAMHSVHGDKEKNYNC